MRRPLNIAFDYLIDNARKASRRASAALVVAACALAVGACGIKGPLDPPTGATQTGEAKSAEAGAAGENSAAKPKPHEPFVLDGIIR